jgi:Holliday junction resolvasome RuvABC endonuclease subunit
MRINPPRVLALDLSMTATGVAEPDGTLTTLRPCAKGDRRLDEIAAHTAALCGRWGIDFAVLEDLPTHARAAGIVGMVHGAARVTLLVAGVPYLTVPPATLKTYATGRGNAPKPDLRMALYKRTGLDVADDNQVDAAWLRLLALDLAGNPELELPQTHRRALAKLALPATVAA